MVQIWLESQSIKTEAFNNANCYTEGKKKISKGSCSMLENHSPPKCHLHLVWIWTEWHWIQMECTGQTLFLDTDGARSPATGSVFLGYLSLSETQRPGVPRNNSKSLVRGSQGPGITGTSPAAVIWLVSPRTVSAILWF